MYVECNSSAKHIHCMYCKSTNNKHGPGKRNTYFPFKVEKTF